jgi:hypothetical protein
MNLDWRLKPHEYLATDALWTMATQKARQIWDDEHNAEAPTRGVAPRQ